MGLPWPKLWMPATKGKRANKANRVFFMKCIFLNSNMAPKGSHSARNGSAFTGFCRQLYRCGIVHVHLAVSKANVRIRTLSSRDGRLPCCFTPADHLLSDR